jgi:hypothetical protein
MDSTAGALLAGTVLVSTTSLLAAGLFWTAATWNGRRAQADGADTHARELRAEVAELGRRVGALQRLLEGVD